MMTALTPALSTRRARLTAASSNPPSNGHALASSGTHASLSTQTCSQQRSWFDAARRANPALTTLALLLLFLMIPTALALMLDTRSLDGVNVWIKPLKFEFSIAVHLLTVAWAMLALPGEHRDGRRVAALVTMMIVASLFEIGYIGLQAARGEASHFNQGTVFTTVMYGLMGLGALMLVIATGLIGLKILRHTKRDDLLAFAAGLGLVLGALLGGLSGVYMSSQPGHGVAAANAAIGNASSLPIVGWSRIDGDLRVAHFFGLHMMQLLPAVALLTVGARAAISRGLVLSAAALGTLFTIVVFVQAIAARPFFH